MKQIPVEQLIEGRWYVGRGRNANVALWGRIGKGEQSRLTFLTIGFRFHQPDVKDEGYYAEAQGCFQPFLLIDEGNVTENVGNLPGWDRHYATEMAFGPTILGSMTGRITCACDCLPCQSCDHR